MSQRPALDRLILIVCAVVLALLFFYRLAFTDLILARGDTYAYFYPYWDARDAGLARGDLPLWSPDRFMGVPLVANTQLGTFYPPNWLTVNLPAPDAIRFSILLHSAWALLGAALLARRSLGVGLLPALLTGGLYGLGGYVGAHVEQINQLQGLAWMPWLFLLLHNAVTGTRPLRWALLLAIAWALQILSGHTQTVFISGVGLGLYALAWPFFIEGQAAGNTRVYLRRVASAMVTIGAAAAVAVTVALPQLVPTQILVSVSNRGDGLNQQEATAFSWDPAIVGRGLLPSYSGQPFGEYIAYIGVIGLGLLVLGAFSSDRRRWPWLVLLAAGLLLAFGRYNPLYVPLASLPGFNLFRVPARWLALFALAGALLAGLGLHTLLSAGITPRRLWRALATAAGLTALLAAWSLLAPHSGEPVIGPAQPTAVTWLAWGTALVVFLLVASFARRIGVRWSVALLVLLALGELWLAAHTLPYHDVTDPAVYSEPRFTVNQIRAYMQDEAPPGRLLSISNLLFEPGDQAALATRWQALGLGQRARDHAFEAVKRQETLAANLPLVWGVPTIDGFDGGVLPTMYYTAFSALLLPEESLRSVDGRLRELLAREDCRGACLPDDRWLDLTQTRYLLADRAGERVHDGVFFDPFFAIPLSPEDTAVFPNDAGFIADSLHLLYSGSPPNAALARSTGRALPLTLVEAGVVVEEYALAVYRLDAAGPLPPTAAQVTGADASTTVYALTLADSRTGDFVTLTPSDWQRIYNGDVKIYENLDVMPRAFVVYDWTTYPDTWDGTEQAGDHMRSAAFDPRLQVVINRDDPRPMTPLPPTPDDARVEITTYSATQVTVEVTTTRSGYLILTDAYYPGWEATNDGQPVDIDRANVMFRAVPVKAGTQTIVFSYSYPWSTLALALGGAVLLLLMVVLPLFVLVVLRSRGEQPVVP
ncbi:MAG: YfhO family protein [Chloroflexota bacterium]